MPVFRKRLIGKTIDAISSSEFDWGISFADGSGITIYTKIVATLFSEEGEMVVTDVRSSEDTIEIIVGKKSCIKISMDSNLLIGPEYFIFQDVDGTLIVEN